MVRLITKYYIEDITHKLERYVDSSLVKHLLTVIKREEEILTDKNHI